MTVTVAGLDGSVRKLSSETIDEFRELLRGRVLRPGDPGLRDSREVFNAMYPSNPGLTVLPSGTADVVQAVLFARQHSLLLAVRGGGHSVAGFSAGDAGFLIDLSPLSAVLVDRERRLVHVQGGALWGDVDRETQQFGLAAPGGNVSDTGVAGLTLGGGYGHVRRKFGLSADNVVEAQVVGADGEVRTVSATSHPDLFWAIRGGGGNFGVVTAFTFRLHELGPQVATAGGFFPISELGSVLRRWRAFVADAPEEVSSSVSAITLPDHELVPEAVRNRPVAALSAVYAGPIEEAATALLPLKHIGQPIIDTSGLLPYTVLQSGFDSILQRNHFQAYWKSQYLRELSDAAIEELTNKAQERPFPLTSVSVLHMGGAINRVSSDESAFAERSAPFLVSIDGLWMDPTDNQRNIAWVRSVWDSLRPYGTGSVYLNFLGRDGEDDASIEVGTAHASNLQRLAKLKKLYDPENLFRLNNNVLPARSAEIKGDPT
jgi:FAD/FMN-containing dehydrogenase